MAAATARTAVATKVAEPTQMTGRVVAAAAAAAAVEEAAKEARLMTSHVETAAVMAALASAAARAMALAIAVMIEAVEDETIEEGWLVLGSVDAPGDVAVLWLKMIGSP